MVKRQCRRNPDTGRRHTDGEPVEAEAGRGCSRHHSAPPSPQLRPLASEHPELLLSTRCEPQPRGTAGIPPSPHPSASNQSPNRWIVLLSAHSLCPCSPATCLFGFLMALNEQATTIPRCREGRLFWNVGGPSRHLLAFQAL